MVGWNGSGYMETINNLEGMDDLIPWHEGKFWKDFSANFENDI